MKISKNCFRR